MRAFAYVAASTNEEAVGIASGASAFLAGGTTLVDLMKLGVVAPEQVIDINALPLRGISAGPDGLKIGALERMSDVAVHPEVAAGYPMIAQALSLSASPQLRNMASIGGNLLQRTRCGYFRDVTTPCNKRLPGSGCPARNGENRTHAILGTSDSCVATHASDLAVALVALDASVRLASGAGERLVRLEDFYRLPGTTPEVENELRPGELITEIVVPPLASAHNSAYLKLRDRRSYEFALTSAAVALDVADGTILQARVAVGGVGTKPWRLAGVEAALRGEPATVASFEAAAFHSGDGARVLAGNGFKVELLRRTIVRALVSLDSVR